MMQSRHSRLRIAAMFFTLTLGLILPIATRHSFAAQLYTNPTAIAFGNGPNALEIADPYPSTITVADLKGSITKVTVTINGFTHSFPDSVDLLLIGPDGKQVLLLSDAGGSTPVSNLSMTFDDAAAGPPSDGGPLTSGTFKPWNYSPLSDTFPTPGPGSLGNEPNTLLSVFHLTNPNGVWQLFAVEDTSGTTGSIANWSLQLETADLEAKVSPEAASVNAGSTLAYSVTVNNYGTEPAVNPTLKIGIPSGTSYVSSDPQGGWTCAAPAAGDTAFTCTIASFANGTQAVIPVTLLVDKALVLNTVLTRTATLSSALLEANTTNNTSSATTTVTTLANLAIDAVDSPVAVDAGAPMTVVVTATNSGPSNAANTTLTIPVPTNTTFVSLSSAAGWTCPALEVGATGNVVCTRPVFSTLTDTFSLVVKVNPEVSGGTIITSTASISSETTDDVPANNSNADTTTVGTSTNLAVVVDSTPNPVSAAANLVYKIDVTNNGPSNAAAATLNTEVRSGTIFVSLESPAGWTCTTPAVGNIGPVSCTNPSFGVISATFNLTVQVLSGTPIGTILNHTSTVTSTTTDTDPASNTANETTEVTVNADLAVDIADVAPTVNVGSTISYTLRVNNSGPEPAEVITLTTAVPANTTFVALKTPAGWTCTTPAVGAEGAITCTNRALDVTTDVLELQVKVSKVPYGTQIPFSATITSSTLDNRPNNNTDTVTFRALDGFRIYLPLVRR